MSLREIIVDAGHATTDTVALMQNGRIIHHGPAAATLTSANLTQTFNCPIEVSTHNGYYAARVRA